MYSGAKRGPKPKSTQTVKIELHPKAYSWLESLLAKGRFGNSLEDIVVHLLNDRFNQLLKEGEIHEGSPMSPTIPFPNPVQQNNEQTKTVRTEQQPPH
jgi:hypothetical protein